MEQMRQIIGVPGFVDQPLDLTLHREWIRTFDTGQLLLQPLDYPADLPLRHPLLPTPTDSCRREIWAQSKS